MRSSLATGFAFLLLLCVDTLLVSAYHSTDVVNDYNDNLARLLFYTRKFGKKIDGHRRVYRSGYSRRSCIRRGGSCDHRPNDCCFSSSCRCNLWGTNCRCQRVGLFQKWGK